MGLGSLGGQQRCLFGFLRYRLRTTFIIDSFWVIVQCVYMSHHEFQCGDCPKYYYTDRLQTATPSPKQCHDASKLCPINSPIPHRPSLLVFFRLSSWRLRLGQLQYALLHLHELVGAVLQARLLLSADRGRGQSAGRHASLEAL
jgi:hypothetical protein